MPSAACAKVMPASAVARSSHQSDQASLARAEAATGVKTLQVRLEVEALPAVAQADYARLAADLDTPVSLMLKLAEARTDTFMLESVTGGEVRGRYSIVGMKPDLIWQCHGTQSRINGVSYGGGRWMAVAESGSEALAAGRISLDQQPVQGPSAERGVVFQDDALLPWQNVLENVAFGLQLAGVAKPQREAKARELQREIDQGKDPRDLKRDALAASAASATGRPPISSTWMRSSPAAAKATTVLLVPRSMPTV